MIIQIFKVSEYLVPEIIVSGPCPTNSRRSDYLRYARLGCLVIIIDQERPDNSLESFRGVISTHRFGLLREIRLRIASRI